MNAFEISEVRRRAALESKTELNQDKLVFALIKNGTHLAKITTDEQLVDTLVEVHNFSIWGIYKNGVKVPTESYTRLSWR